MVVVEPLQRCQSCSPTFWNGTFTEAFCRTKSRSLSARLTSRNGGGLRYNRVDRSDSEFHYFIHIQPIPVFDEGQLE